MKYYILSFLLLFSFGLKAQITYTPLNAAGYQIKYLKVDSGFALPVADTTLMRNVIRPGLMVINTLDSLPYYYSGTKWKPVYVDSAGVIGLINKKVDSVTINGSTMFYWIAGLGYGTTINKIDSVTQSHDSVFTWINGHSTYSFLLTSGSGTVTRVIGGYGLVSDTITSNGILLVDTSVIAAKSWSTAQFAPISHTHSASDIISGTLPIARGGTGMSGIGAVGQLIRVAASGTALEYFSPDYYNSATSLDSSMYSLNKVNGDKTVFVFDGQTGSITQTALNDTAAAIRSSFPSAGYTSYVATLTETAGSAPVATVLQNNTGYTFTYSYLSTGYYRLTCSGTAFSSGHSYVLTQNQAFAPVTLFEWTIVSTTQIELHVRGTDGTTYDTLNGTIEIRIYP